MRRPRVSAAFLFAVLLCTPMIASAVNCCPPAGDASPALAAAGCCGQCPTTLTPEPEPASISMKASSPAASPVVVPASTQPAPQPPEGPSAAGFARPPLAFGSRLSPVPLRI